MKVKDIEGNLDKRELSFILSTDKIVSVNQLYNDRVGRKGGKAYPIIYKSPAAVKFTEEVEEQLLTLDFKELAPWIWEVDYFDMTVNFILNSNFNSRDTSNGIKLLEDCVFRHLGLNDSRVLSWHAWKSFLPKSKEELICIRINESTFNYKFDDLGVNS